MFTRAAVSQTTFAARPLTATVMRAALSVIRAAAGLGRALTHRRDVRLLLELDDRQLKDIGLVRNDVLGALAGPIGKDPSIVLLVRSVEQRSRLRGMALAPRRVNGRPLVQIRA